MSGTWARDALSTNATAQNGYFIDSEMWFTDGACQPYWVEEGLSDGWEYAINKGAYESFWAYNTTGNHYAEFPIAFFGPNASTTDNYQISRSGSTNVWNIWWDGTLNQTPNVGFWQGACLQTGGEVYSTDGHADTFNMYMQAINTSYQYVNWGAQGGIVTDPTQLNGQTYQNSEWSWNTKT